MTETPDKADIVTTPASNDKMISIDAGMIASNVDFAIRQAPAANRMSVIDEIYDFADRLRAGSTPRSKTGA